MMRLLTAIVLALWSSQAPASTTLSPALRAELKAADLQAVTAIRGLPLGVRESLTTVFGGSLDIANPGEAWQAAAPRPGLPLRRLVAAGCSVEICLIYYERGGTSRTWHVMLFRWTPAATTFEWGGTAPAGLKTVGDVRAAVLAGAVKSPSKVW